MREYWPGLHRRQQKRARGGGGGVGVVVKLLVKRARFTVSISTFSLCRSIGSFSPTSILRSPVQSAPLQLPFILATLELVDVSVSPMLEVTAALPSAGSAQAHLSML